MRYITGKRLKFGRFFDFERPSTKGIKWSFFLFSISLKNASIKNNFFLLIMHLIELFITIFPACYPLFFNSNNTQNERSIFQFSDILTFITPNLIPENAWFNLVFLFLFIVIIGFVCCLYNPSLTLYLHLLLNARIHLIILPIISATFSYATNCCVFHWYTKNSIIFIIGNIIIFPFYLLLISLLCFTEANSISNAEIFSAEWFSNFALFYPIEIAITSIVGFQTFNYSNTIIQAFLITGSIISLLFIGCVIYYMPMIFYFANEIQVTKHILIIILFVFSQFSIEFNLQIHNLILSLIPFFFCLVFIIVHLVYNRRRYTMKQLISQIDTDLEQLTIESLEQILSPVTSQYSLIRLVKHGLISGSRAVISDTFVNYCLKSYPESEWFIGYVCFLYGIIWNSHPNVYRFFLHLLSLDSFSFSIQYLLFQYIFFYMQVAQDQSPLVYRNLIKYRQLALKFAISHKKFWTIHSMTNSNDFRIAKNKLYDSFTKLKHQASILDLMFPFSPSVKCELSIFNSDIMHNIENANQEYWTASYLLNPLDDYIPSKLFSGFSLIFHGFNKSLIDPKTPEYKFLSFQESYDNANRQGVSFNINDSYIKSLSHTFSMNRNNFHKSQEIFNIHLFIIYLFIFFFSILYIIGLFFHGDINSNLFQNLNDIYNLTLVIDQTVLFKQNINSFQFDIFLLDNLANNKYSNFSVSFSIFPYILNHLSITDSELAIYKYFVDNIQELISNENYSFDNQDFLNNINNNYHSFSYYYSRLHEKSLFFLNSQLANQTIYADPISDLDDIINELSNVINRLYQNLRFIINYKLEHTQNIEYRRLIILIALEIIILIFGIFFLCITFNRISNTIYSVICTVQPPISKNIFSSYDKVISYFEDQNQTELFEISNSETPLLKNEINMSNYRLFYFPRMLFPYIIIILLLLIYPSYLALAIPNIKNDINSDFKKLPDLYENNEISQFIYFSLAKLEFLMLPNNIGISNYSSFVMDADHPCFYQIFKNSSSSININREYNTLFQCISNELNMNIISSTGITLSFILFIGFLCCSHYDFKQIEFEKLLIKFIPNNSTKTNPFFSTIALGSSVSNKQFHKFNQDSLTNVNEINSLFFCILLYKDTYPTLGRNTGEISDYEEMLNSDNNSLQNSTSNPMNQNGNDNISKNSVTQKIIGYIGNVQQYLKFIPDTLQSLQQFLILKCPENQNEILSFFNEKEENSVLNLSTFPGYEISLIFAKNPDSLVIKNNSHNYESNLQVRKTQKLIKAINSFPQFDFKNLENIFLCMISAKNDELLNHIREQMINRKDFVLIDSRNHILCFSTNSISSKQASSSLYDNIPHNISMSAKKMLSLIDTIYHSNFIKDIKIVVTFGETLFFFDSVKNQATKSRCVGKCYDSAKILLNYSEYGQPLMTKEIYSYSGENIEAFHFEDKHIGSDMNVSIRIS